MAAIENTRQRYGIVAIVLHWVMAALLITLLALGLYMTSLPDAGFDKTKITLILYHKELGVLAFALASVRLAWRVGNVLPALVAGLPEWQQLSARFVHLALYGVMFALPLTGWLMSSAAGIPVSFLSLFNLPDLVARNDRLFHLMIEVHAWLAYLLIGLLVLHIGAALEHHFIFKDETLKKMLPGGS